MPIASTPAAVLALMALIAAPLAAQPPRSTTPRPRAPAAAARPAPAPTRSARDVPPFRVEETTIGAIRAALATRRLTCRQLVQAYLDRIAAYDKQGPAINAWVVLNPQVLAIADSLDRRYADAGPVGPLHCIPVAVKDNFETNDLQTTAGSLALKGWIPRRDATMVARLRAAGAIILGKTNLAEWAFTPYETVSSILPGYTRNPYALDRVTAGSSGGTAAAVAANLAESGLGSDTGNSIRGPSAHQALVGIRSTMGLTSRAGVIPLNALADIAGPMARTVADAVELLTVVAGADSADPITLAANDHSVSDYREFLAPGRLAGARIGVLRQAYERPTTDSEVVRVTQRALAVMEKAGAVVIDPARLDSLDAILARAQGPCNPFKYDLERYFEARGEGAPVRTVEQVLKSGAFHPSTQLRLQNAAAVTETPAASKGCQSREAMREVLRGAVTALMDSLKLDALVYPTWSNPPRLIGDLNTPHGDNSQLFAPLTGFPAITVPMGWTRGGMLPAGLTFFGRAWSEPVLIALAADFERLHAVRRPPLSAPALGDRALVAEITEQGRRYNALLERQDAAAIAAMYAADGEVLNAGRRIVGPAAVRAHLETFAAYHVLENRSATLEVRPSATGATEIGSFRQRVVVPQGDTVLAVGRYTIDWVRTPAGWRVKRMDTGAE